MEKNHKTTSTTVHTDFNAEKKDTLSVAPVCNPTLEVIGLKIPCMERAGVVVDAFQLFLRLKY